MAGYSTGLANQIISDGAWTHSYDPNGNQVQKFNAAGEYVTFAYDNRNCMVGAQDSTTGLTATYNYDALRQRIEADVTIGGVTTITRFGYDDSRQIVTDLNGSNVLQ